VQFWSELWEKGFRSIFEGRDFHSGFQSGTKYAGKFKQVSLPGVRDESGCTQWPFEQLCIRSSVQKG
jgi:hypothetical protein